MFKGVLFDISFSTWKMPSISTEACWVLWGSLPDASFLQELDLRVPLPQHGAGDLLIIINGLKTCDFFDLTNYSSCEFFLIFVVTGNFYLPMIIQYFWS